MASQNRPKTLQKSIPNRCSRASLISYAIVAQTFDVFRRQNFENIIFYAIDAQTFDIFKCGNLENINFPMENQCFSGFREKHVCAVFVHFSFQKSSQNPSKTRSEPFKNRCRKRVDFQHRFFEVLASIWEGLGPPRWSQVGHFGLKILWCSDFFTLLS